MSEMSELIQMTLADYPNGIGSRRIADAIGADEEAVLTELEGLAEEGIVIKNGRAWKLREDQLEIPSDIDANAKPIPEAGVEYTDEPTADVEAEVPSDVATEEPEPEVDESELTYSALKVRERNAELSATYRLNAHWLRNQMGRDARVSGVARGKEIRGRGHDLKRLLEKGYISHMDETV